MARPQQPELARSERGKFDQDRPSDKQATRGRPDIEGHAGPVPEENQPGHRPDEEQDKPQGPPGAEASD
ncbi:MAG: hypothetical protein M3245_05935 [Actinomycetota bacterium]|nr:hypothetical protein [Actinomycetota bacterium]